MGLVVNKSCPLQRHPINNHPSGVAEPSQSDRLITERLKTAVELVDIRLLDHIVVGCGVTVSFAERGWL